MSVGDIDSTERGSGARFNTGKPDMSLVPLSIVADCWRKTRPDSIHVEVLGLLGAFQASGNTQCLYAAMQLMGHDAWKDCAKVFEYGRRKYAAWNWAKGMAWSIPVACAARHLLAVLEGQSLDPESGESHDGHTMCNLVMLVTFANTYPEGNDLPPVGLLP